MGRPRPGGAGGIYCLFLHEKAAQATGSSKGIQDLHIKWAEAREALRDTYKQKNKQMKAAYEQEVEAFAEKIASKPRVMRLWLSVATDAEKRVAMPVLEGIQQSARHRYSSAFRFSVGEQIRLHKIDGQRTRGTFKSATKQYSLLSEPEKENLRKRWLEHKASFTEEENILAAEMEWWKRQQKQLKKLCRPELPCLFPFGIFMQECALAGVMKDKRLGKNPSSVGSKLWSALGSAGHERYKELVEKRKDEYENALLAFAERLRNKPDAVQAWLAISRGLENKVAVAWTQSNHSEWSERCGTATSSVKQAGWIALSSMESMAYNVSMQQRKPLHEKINALPHRERQDQLARRAQERMALAARREELQALAKRRAAARIARRESK